MESATVARAAPEAPEAPAPTQEALKALLLEDPTAFEFFQAVRLLERLRPDRAGVGGFAHPAEEVVHFGVPPSIAFPPSDIAALEMPDDGPARMSVTFMGLTGPDGVLPHHYTLQVADRVRARDRTLRDFLDLFHHRIVSLFYRAWRKLRFTAAYEAERRDRVTEHLLDLVGLGLDPLRHRTVVPDESLLFYTGLLAPQRRSAVGLQQLLSDFFTVPVEVQQFVGGWYPLAESTQCSVGEGADASGQLGLGAVAGDEIWDPQARVRVRVGPLTRTQYDPFLPGGSAHAALATLVRFYSHDQFDFEIQLVLARDEVPACVLGAEAEAPAPLGWCTWVRSAPSFARDADETILTLRE